MNCSMIIIVSMLLRASTQGNTNDLIFDRESVIGRSDIRMTESGVQLGMSEQAAVRFVKFRKGDLLFHLSLENKSC